jgi:hypothetical protein
MISAHILPGTALLKPPGIVLDPFAGAATTGLVRRWEEGGGRYSLVKYEVNTNASADIFVSAFQAINLAHAAVFDDKSVWLDGYVDMGKYTSISAVYNLCATIDSAVDDALNIISSSGI